MSKTEELKAAYEAANQAEKDAYTAYHCASDASREARALWLDSLVDDKGLRGKIVGYTKPWGRREQVRFAVQGIRQEWGRLQVYGLLIKKNGSVGIRGCSARIDDVTVIGDAP